MLQLCLACLSDVVLRRIGRIVTRYRKSLSNTPDADFCLKAPEEALDKGRSEFFKTDQSSKYTSEVNQGIRTTGQVGVLLLIHSGRDGGAGRV